MFETKEFPEFSWSHTRHKTLKECTRKYAYEYYFSHNGWLAHTPRPFQHAYRLKKIVTLEMLFGQIVHDVIGKTITRIQKTRCIPEAEELEQLVRQNLRKAFLESRDLKKAWFLHPNRYTMLFEMYYHGELSEESIHKIQRKLNNCLNYFLNSKSFQDIVSNQQLQILGLERFRQIDVQNVQVYTVLDLIYKDCQKDKWIIVDWKTGKKPADDLGQLAIYAIYLIKKFNVPLENIEIRNEHLTAGSCHKYHLTTTNIEAMLDHMATSIKTMQDYQLDTRTNKPLPLEEFQKTENKVYCKQCKYQELCTAM